MKYEVHWRFLSCSQRLPIIPCWFTYHRKGCISCFTVDYYVVIFVIINPLLFYREHFAKWNHQPNNHSPLIPCQKSLLITYQCMCHFYPVSLWGSVCAIDRWYIFLNSIHLHSAENATKLLCGKTLDLWLHELFSWARPVFSWKC